MNTRILMASSFGVCLITTSGNAAPKPVDNFPLTQVFEEAQAVLDQYQTSKDSHLPDLVSADFDFKTVVSGTKGVSINFIIFTLGASRQKQVTNDVEFLYKGGASVPVATLVTAGLNIEANKNSTQTVKLTFAEKSNSCK